MLQILNYPKFQQVAAKFASKFDTKTAEGRSRLLVISAFSLGVFLLYDNLFGKQHVYKQSCIFYARHFTEKQPLSSFNEEGLIKRVEESSCFEEAVERLNTDLSEEDFKELKEILESLPIRPPKINCPNTEGQVVFRRQVASTSFDIYANYFPDAPLWMRHSLPFLSEYTEPSARQLSKIGLFALALRYLIRELQCTFYEAKGHTEPRPLSFLKKLEINKEYKNLRIVAALATVIGIIINHMKIKFPLGIDAYLDEFPPTAPFSNTYENNDSYATQPCVGRALINFCETEEKRIIFVEGDKKQQNKVFESAIWLSKINYAAGRYEKPLFFFFDLKKYPPACSYERSYDNWKKYTQELWNKINNSKMPILIIEETHLSNELIFLNELKSFLKNICAFNKDLKVVVQGKDCYEILEKKYDCLKELLDSKGENLQFTRWQCDSDTIIIDESYAELKTLDNLLFFSKEQWEKNPKDLFERKTKEKLSEIQKYVTEGPKVELQKINNQEVNGQLDIFDESIKELKRLDQQIKVKAYELLNCHRWWYGDKIPLKAGLNVRFLRKKSIEILLMKRVLEKKALNKAFEVQKKLDQIHKSYFSGKSLILSSSFISEME